MHQFSQFDLKLNLGRLPLIYSLGDLSSIREMFTPENGDIGRTQLPILPPISESIPQNGNELEGYLVEVSSPLMVSIREFLKSITLRQELQRQRKKFQHSDVAQNYAKIRRECMNRVGSRLVEVIRQERRLGLYNLFWLMISKHIVSLFDRVIAEKGEKQTRRKIEMLPILAQAFLETIQQVQRYLQQEDQKKRRYSQYIDDTMTSHLGASFNHEFSRFIITDQIHLICPHISRNTLLECAQSIFVEENEKYHISYEEFVEIYSGVRTYIEKRLQQEKSVFCDMVANVLRIPCQTISKMPIESLVFHPTVISVFAEEIKQLPAKGSNRRKKTLFKSWAPQLGDIFGEDSWEFAIADYLNFARDLRRSEIVAFLRNRIVFVTSNQRTTSSSTVLSAKNASSSGGIANKISYQFEKGRTINDLRDVTLIFLDLRGFTELSAGDVSDQALKLYLYNFFDPVVNIINHFEGVIKTYAGDGILASFGGKGEHTLNAVRAAIEIQKFFTILKQEDKIAFTGMGIGIHTGLVEETYFFPDLEAPSHNTVIGLSANLVGRLSSGKTEKKGDIDTQAVKSLKDYIQANDPNLAVGSGALAIFEDRLIQAIDALQQQKHRSNSEQEQEGVGLKVKVVSGVLNNQGIAISNETLKHIHAIQPFQEQEIQKRIQYTYFDKVLQIHVTFIKAGDAIFKGVKGKFPVWGVYLPQNSEI